MGCAPSKMDNDEKVAVEQNAKIDRMLRLDRKEEARTIKILLLGEWLYLWFSPANCVPIRNVPKLTSAHHQEPESQANLRSSSKCGSFIPWAFKKMKGSKFGL